jgi:23S rRNA pseudouridine1911/1915/1917 synthase
MRKGKPYIPPGAPGHPRTGAEPRGSRAFSDRPPKSRSPRDERAPREEAPTKASRFARVAPSKARLVYEDEDLLVYDKPAGLPVIAADGSRSRSLLDIATDQIKRSNPKGRAAVVHRIDRDTSGLVVFATKARVKKELMQGWDELVSERRYVALVEGSMGGASGSYDSWLKENKAGQVFRAGIGERGAKRALTRWRLLGEGSGLSLLELSLATGRKHQIRVQLSDAGHPLIGDERYGSLRDDLGRLCLHAASIELKLPGRDALRVESPPPSEFEAALRRNPREAPKPASVGASPKSATVNTRNAPVSASRSATRRDAPPRPKAPRGKKPSTR